MSERATKLLQVSPEAAFDARQFVRQNVVLDSMRYTEADLLVTELIGNVVAHAPHADEIRLDVAPDAERRVRITVSNGHTRGLENVSRGVGLTLVDRVSQSWGWDHSDGELSVWFTVRSPGAHTVSDELSDEDLIARLSQDEGPHADALVRRHRDLAIAISRRYRGKGLPDEDLEQVALMALLKAVQRYDPDLGELRPYAAATISGEMKKLLRDRGWSVRVPRSVQEKTLRVGKAVEELTHRLGRPPDDHEVADHLSLTLDEVEEALKARGAYSTHSLDRPTETSGLSILDRLDEVDITLAGAEDRVVLEQVIARLPERQRQILELRFNEDMTQSEIAEIVGISQMHVSRLLAKAVDTLREQLEDEPEPQT
jgi:RNA polymerase sigma-B factor